MNELKVNHNDFVALHSIGKFSEGLKCLISSGILYTCREQAGNSREKFINYRSSGRNRTYALVMPVQCSCH